jgi:aminocarboxymuconate-semialdehyde decarboxylase
MIIDVHAHALHEESLAKLGFKKVGDRDFIFRDRGPDPVDRLLHDMEGRLESLEKREIDLQLVGPPPYITRKVANENDIEYSRIVNQQTNELVKEGGGKLMGMAVIAWGQSEKACEELKRAVGEYGFQGVTIGTCAAHGKPLDEKEFAGVFDLIERLELLIFMHPIMAVSRESLNEYTLNVLIGYPHETAIAVSRMIFSGILERHPNLKLVLAHGGGTLPFLKGRLNRGYHAPKYEYNPDCTKNITKQPGDYFKQLHFDTCVLSPSSLSFLTSLVGADRVMFGTDFPFEIGDAEGELALPMIQKMPEKEQQAILFGNASALLKAKL